MNIKRFLKTMSVVLLALIVCIDPASAQRGGRGGGGRGGGGMRGGGGGFRGSSGGMRGFSGGARSSISSRPRAASRPVQRPSAIGSRPGSSIANRPGQGSGIRDNAGIRNNAGNRVGNNNINRGDRINNNDINFDQEIDIDGDGAWGWNDGCCWHGAGIAAATAGAVVGAAAASTYDDYPYYGYPSGSVVYSLPPTTCTTVVVGGGTYQQCGDAWYQPSFYGDQVQYIVVDDPN